MRIMNPVISMMRKVQYRVFLVLFLAVTFVAVPNGTHASNWGDITIYITPAEVTGSAQWYITYDDKHSSGESQTVNLKNDVVYTIQFTSVEGYQAPANLTVQFASGQTSFSTTVEYIPVGGDEKVTVDVPNWPLWPQKRTSYSVWEPYSFTSIGRDVMAWVVFDNPDTANPTFWVSDLKVTIMDTIVSGDVEETIVTKVEPEFSDSVQTYGYIQGGQIHEFPATLSGVVDDLRDYAIIPEYVPGVDSSEWWLMYDPDELVSGDEEYYANQDFDTSWLGYDEWITFLQEGIEIESVQYVLEDSGHAPPVTMWAKDNWLVYYVDNYVVPSAWMDGETEKVFIFLPTNQGMLNCFEVNETPGSLGVSRIWSVMPFPAFQQAVYNQVRYENDGQYPRLTVLDGPVYVHDVQDDAGNWKRVLVGSTGLGTEQVNKIGPNWTVEDSDMPQPGGGPAITGKSKIFGIYAIDVTDPYNPDPLWSVTNIQVQREDGASVMRVIDDEGNSLDAEDFPYSDIDMMTAKPQIGFTETEDGTRTWHLLMVGVDNSDFDTPKYVWIDADPLTGVVRERGYFNGFDGQTPETLPSEDTFAYNFEDWYPSRMLAAYPQEEGSLPVLSDVYVYLSNGTFYSWDLASEEAVPVKVFNVYTNEGHTYPAPPITDFDIAYFGGDVYLAATAPLDYPGVGQPHDTYGLLLVNLTLIQEKEVQDLNTQGSQGQSGDEKIRLVEDGVVMIQLQTGKGGNAYDFNELTAAPLFAGETLYQAQYTDEGDVSRLYTLDLSYLSDISGSSGQVFLPDDPFIDVIEQEFSAMTVNSEGDLLLLNEDGDVVLTIEDVIDLGDGSGGGSSELNNLEIVYWKTK